MFNFALDKINTTLSHATRHSIRATASTLSMLYQKLFINRAKLMFP